MEYLKIILTSLLSLAALFILTKLDGSKQISELTMFDYIIGISIGSIASEMATELENPYKPLIAMTVFALASLGMSIASAKSLKIRRIVFGRSLILMFNGKLYRRNLKKARMDLSDFLMQCRTNGYFDISEINIAVLEPSGKISILPFSDETPVTAKDLKITPSGNAVFYNVIMDGQILDHNLKSAGRDRRWLSTELKSRGIENYSSVFLATLDDSGTLNVFLNSREEESNDFFE